jgi:ketosteroid isomerase-like protein
VTDVIHQMLAAMNAHDLDAAANLMHEDYRSEQPAHPSLAFVGRAQMRANWAAMFTGIPDLQAELCRSVTDGDTAWSEWHWWGTTLDGRPFESRGVTLFEIRDGQVVAGRLYMEDVDREVVNLDDVVEARTGLRPQFPPD